MAATTYRSFIDGLEALSISGVVQAYTEGVPASISRLPASFVQLPEGEERAIRAGTPTGWPTLRADLVVLYEAAGKGDQGPNFDGTVDMMDAVQAALRGFDPGQVRPSWSMRMATVTVAGTGYWAVVASVEVEG